ncbi:MAG TPA: TonB-dependent receptor [Anditalea sp.]|nr:TonB-dependent receptor [Anditalea sp.]
MNIYSKYLYFKKVHFTFSLLFLLFSGSSLFAQNTFKEITFQANQNQKKLQYSLTGKIISEETKEPISGVSVHIDGLFTGINSDRFGQYFVLLDSGRHRIVFRQLGKTTDYYIINLYGNGQLDVELTNMDFQLELFTVNAEERDKNIRNAITGITKMNIEEIKLVPTLLGEPDVFNVLQSMPGVTSVGEGSAGLNIRGGQADQNLIMMNEAIVLSNSHALGFLSAFNGDAVQNFTLYKGTIPSNFGGRSSAELNIEMRKGDFEKWNNTYSIGTAVSKFSIDGPLNPGKTSILAAARRSNANWLLNSVRDQDIKNSNIRFHDIYGGIQHKFSQKSILDFNLLNTGDYFRLSDQFGYNWNNFVTSLTSKNLISENFSLIGMAAYGSFNNSYFEPTGTDPSEVKNGLQYYQGKLTGFYTGEKIEITFGAEAVHYKMRPETLIPFNETSGIFSDRVNKQNGLEVAPFASLEWNLNENLSFSAGVRYSHYTQYGPDSLYHYQDGLPRTRLSITSAEFIDEGAIVSYSGIEPRASFRWTFKEINSIKGGYSSMNQYLQTISNATGPTPIDLWQLSTSYILPQRSHNFSLGYFRNFKENEWSTSFESYFRFTENQLDYRDFAELFLNRHLETELIQGQGQAYGAEIMIQRNIGGITGWLAYTYSRSLIRTTSEHREIQTNRGNWYPTNFDRPHILSLVTNIHLGKGRFFNTNVNYSTGRPFTGVVNNYLVSGITVPHFGDRNQFRIPNYFRVDISYMTNGLVRQWDDKINFSIYNLLGRRNAYSVFYIKENAPRLIPYQISIIGSFFPSVSYTVALQSD